MKKFLAILMALALVLSLGVSGFASGEASAETAVEEAGPKAMIVIGDEGRVPEDEQTEGFELAGGTETEDSLSGFVFTSDSSDAALFFSEVSEDTGKFYTIGGEGTAISTDEYDATPEAVEWLQARGVAGFDSAVILGADDAEASCSPVISAKGYTYLNINGVLVLAAGTARSAFYSDVVGGTTVAGPGAGGMSNSTQTPVVVVRNSLLETTGVDGVEGAISFGNSAGRARGIQPQGKSITYLYDSAVVSHTWGAFSTDSARQSLELVAYRSLALSQNGYGSYADTSCHLFLYGSTSQGCSDGIVASNDGEIYAVSSACEQSGTELRAIMGKTANRDVAWQDYEVAEGETVESCIKGGQTAVQFHMPDQGHSGAGNTRKATLYMEGGSLVTDESLVAADISAYNAHYAGACIVTKSTQANILLVGTAMESWNGVLIHCMINSDSNVNNIADGDEAPGSDVTLQDMDVAGDIVHDDYQRALRLTLDNTTLTGAIYSNTCEDWNEFCTAEFEGEYILNPDGYETIWGVELTLTNGAVWNVTETSVVTDLIINDGCAVNGTITENPDGTLTVAPLASGEAS